ncbi:hypothetical protein [Clostridium septicum]|uniref:Uncharacterized protein n=1 Tax=Clostridium septicum TaxID=1504 RepID=A0ABY5B3H0_CLOSE|nr:hypothetical protein [Clostridium septicum]UEC19649.1 hypothetical protein LK444_09455 [Clostridium septicum]USS02290.1 hypothetical protein NH397_07720 [Clostridium septicum]WLF70873.1 hypothetical protein Q6375_07825 [Clostridium septicum]
MTRIFKKGQVIRTKRNSKVYEGEITEIDVRRSMLRVIVNKYLTLILKMNEVEIIK